MVMDKMLKAFVKGIETLGEGFVSMADAWTSFSVFPTKDPLRSLTDIDDERPSGFSRDKEFLRKDWRAVGGDLRNVFDDLEKAAAQYKKEKANNPKPGDKL